jgi:hypothetical protein
MEFTIADLRILIAVDLIAVPPIDVRLAGVFQFGQKRLQSVGRGYKFLRHTPLSNNFNKFSYRFRHG